MTPEDIARRFERRHGYELVDYAEVALPLYRLNVDAVSMVHREIPPIKEFTMRAVAAGLGTIPEVAGFLGLDDTTVSATFETLENERYITPGVEGEPAGLADRGREAITKMRESSPQDEMLVFLYDRLLLKPVRLGAEQLMVPANIDPLRLIEIRPYPAEGPEISDISLSEVSHVLEEDAGGKAAFGRDVLRLKRISRRVRVYRPGVALIYKKMRSSEIQIAFIVDDARHEGLEHTFAERGGPKRMGFVKSIDESASASELRRYLGPEVLQRLPDSAQLDEKRIAVSLARLRYQTALSKAERLGERVTQEFKEAVLTAAASLEGAKSELEQFPARPVAPYELVELLGKAIDASERTLLIASRTLDRSIVDAGFLKRLEVLLQAGTRVSISLGEIDIDTVAAEVEKLRTRYPTLDVAVGRRGQFYYLVSDNRFAAISNRPFLSNLGKVRSFHHVVGYLLQEEKLVEAFADRVDPVRAGDRPRRGQPSKGVQ